MCKNKLILLCAIFLCICNYALVAEEETGTLYVSCSNYGLYGVSVYVDGSYKGTAPCTVYNLRPGTHYVRLSKSGYDDASTSVYVSAGSSQSVSLKIPTSSIRVSCTNSTLTGVSVYIDGHYEGTAPCTVDNLTRGSHTVRISKAGYEDASTTVYVYSGTTEYVSLTIPTASLYVSANVSGASVYLNGSYQGTTPLYLTDLAPGSYSVRVEKTHYQTARNSITLETGYRHTLTFSLEKISGYLTVYTSPSNATVYCGSTVITGTTELDEGTYNITGRSFGYNDKTERVVIQRNKYHTLNLSLSKAKFEINNFVCRSESFTPDEKSCGSIYFVWSVTAPETGTITVTDSSSSIVYSSNTRFTTWNQCIEWDGKVNGIYIPDGKYNVTLSAGGLTQTTSFEVKTKRTASEINKELGSARIAVQKEIAEESKKNSKSKNKSKTQRSSRASNAKSIANDTSSDKESSSNGSDRRTIFGYENGRDGIYLEGMPSSDFGGLVNIVGLYDFNKYFSIGPCFGFNPITITEYGNSPCYVETSLDDNNHISNWYFKTQSLKDCFNLNFSLRAEAGLPLGIFYPYAFVGAGAWLCSGHSGMMASYGAGIDMRLIKKHLSLGLVAEGNSYFGFYNIFSVALVAGYHF